ncbi:MAG: decaprenyl-phosphate phosphoribosyltransferase [Candidatus Eisenbacteria bacterium]|uniref:Decaprenyl-phosphate phosphoribosyltransferase n=1 Tax=Eiseniibacteriota bacterium TaxID=2212470 RepID=A0A948W4S4_UNCEI|nr:decaprenyl-phosphate phosphoribosyltransferase [Candidatus Eisenbacteria bacterium]MBU1950652.1 decaprenyl-phosphate phosphoribosyltransferase [Candidatus Eisenbacteria bacterium]MBU2689649.1 decaprenyl-phosphate phosphoribosyltransferase [Candidatus Eisenbacteria bacterium]
MARRITGVSRGVGGIMKTLIHLLRVRQWTKNVVLFAGVVFAQEFTHTASLLRALAGFGTFCLLSSAVYIFNDLADLEQDRAHPQKKNRPLAAGRFPITGALVLALVLAFTGLILAFKLQRSFGILAMAYFIVNLLYSWKLKRVVLLDVMIIAIGFVIRAVAGVEVLSPPAEISPWLLVCTFFLALFLAVAKRRHERTLLLDNAGSHRAILAEYPPALLDQFISIVTAATILGYTIYTVSPQTQARLGTSRLVYTVPFVVFGIFRYLYLVFKKGQGGAPSEALLADGPLLINIILWFGAVLTFLYLIPS